MEELKNIIKVASVSGQFKTVGQLYGMYMLEDGSGLYKDGDIQKRIYTYLKEQLPVWEEKYGITSETELVELLKVI